MNYETHLIWEQCARHFLSIRYLSFFNNACEIEEERTKTRRLQTTHPYTEKTTLHMKAPWDPGT